MRSLIKKGKLPAEVEEYMMMYKLSKEFGWKPDEIREMRIEDVMAYASMVGAIAEIEEEELRKVKTHG